MSMYQEQTLTDLMGERGFKFHDVTKLQESNKYCFRFVKSIVICEVIANGIYRFIYTNKEILGWVTSGWLDQVTNNDLFNERLLLFIKTIEPLVNVYGEE